MYSKPFLPLIFILLVHFQGKAQDYTSKASSYLLQTNNGTNKSAIITFGNAFIAELKSNNTNVDTIGKKMALFVSEVYKKDKMAAHYFLLKAKFESAYVLPMLKSLGKEERAFIKEQSRKVIASYQNSTDANRTYIKNTTQASRTADNYWMTLDFKSTKYQAKIPRNKYSYNSTPFRMPRTEVNGQEIGNMLEIVAYYKSSDKTTNHQFAVAKFYVAGVNMSQATNIQGNLYLFLLSAGVNALYPNKLFLEAKRKGNIYKLSSTIDKSVGELGSKVLFNKDDGTSTLANLFHRHGDTEVLVHMVKFKRRISKMSDLTANEKYFLENYSYRN